MPVTRPRSMKARAVRVSDSAAISASVADFSNSLKTLSNLRRKWWAASRKIGIVAHPRRGEREAGAVADAAQGRDGLAALAFGEAAPDLGAGAVGREVVHVDPLLAEEGEDVLACRDELGRAAVLHGAAERAEAVAVLGGLGEVDAR